jgi:hypothetical protein
MPSKSAWTVCNIKPYYIFSALSEVQVIPVTALQLKDVSIKKNRCLLSAEHVFKTSFPSPQTAPKSFLLEPYLFLGVLKVAASDFNSY